MSKVDLDMIYNYYLQIDANVAVRIYNGILDDSGILTYQPLIAPFEQTIKPSEKYRSLVVSKGRFKLIYYVADNTVKIVCVWGCRQNPARLRRTIKRRNG